jgi:hypothetical protein
MFIKTNGGKQKVSVAQRKGFMNGKFGLNARSKRMNEGRNFYKITKTIMAGSESRTSTCKYKDSNIIERHNEVIGRLCHEAKRCKTVPTRKKASEPIGYLQIKAVDS